MPLHVADALDKSAGQHSGCWGWGLSCKDTHSWQQCVYYQLACIQVKDKMTKSTVVNSETGGSMDSEVRTSTGSFYDRGHDKVGIRLMRVIIVPLDTKSQSLCPCRLRRHWDSAGAAIWLLWGGVCSLGSVLLLLQIIERIEKRLSHISFLPVDNGEGLQILHYVVSAVNQPSS